MCTVGLPGLWDRLEELLTGSREGREEGREGSNSSSGASSLEETEELLKQEKRPIITSSGGRGSEDGSAGEEEGGEINAERIKQQQTEAIGKLLESFENELGETEEVSEESSAVSGSKEDTAIDNSGLERAGKKSTSSSTEEEEGKEEKIGLLQMMLRGTLLAKRTLRRLKMRLWGGLVKMLLSWRVPWRRRPM